jgi:hypothetical protein
MPRPYVTMWKARREATRATYARARRAAPAQRCAVCGATASRWRRSRARAAAVACCRKAGRLSPPSGADEAGPASMLFAVFLFLFSLRAATRVKRKKNDAMGPAHSLNPRDGRRKETKRREEGGDSHPLAAHVSSWTHDKLS